MLKMIEKLLAKEHAYVAEGHVLFDIASAKNYGCLSHRSVDEMIEGARVEVAPYKKHPADFVLWKPSAASQIGWNSPWGRGRPGWHLECSVMIEALLGERMRPRRQTIRALLATQRLHHYRRRQNGEVGGEFHYPARSAQAFSRRMRAFGTDAGALQKAARLDARHPTRSAAELG